jgi:general secretion pathway protein E
VHPAIGLDFAAVLRAILRQDPDVIMVGEIRDLETARIAAQASLTGHLVLSTVHTNSAVATLTRLLDMGLDDYLLASTIRAVLAQRLVRRLCVHCAMPERDGGQFDALARKVGLACAHLDLKRPVGCAKCRGTGFSGRIALSEFLVVTAAVRELIRRRASEGEVLALATAEGMRPLLADGLIRAADGTTTVAEVMEAVGGG